MKALMYGAGNIGRGFIGPLMVESGYEVTFVDVNRQLVDGLNQAGEYTLRILSDEGCEDRVVKGIDALLGTQKEVVVRAIADCDLMATALGAKILPRIAPLIAEGLSIRRQENRGPLNIIICENLPNANKIMQEAIKAALREDERNLEDGMLGLVEASIGRMVPVQTPEMQEGDPLRVCVEAYAFLPVDKDAFRGGLPMLKGMVPYTPFDYYMRRKLFVHNLGHATCAYLGMYDNKSFIHEAVSDSMIELCARQAMLESVSALSITYGTPLESLLNHLDDLVVRFGNRLLGDTCERVGQDIPRKMQPGDRLLGAALFCLSVGVTPSFIALTAAAALYRYIYISGLKEDVMSAESTLRTLMGGASDDILSALIMEHYPLFVSGASIRELKMSALKQKHRRTGAIV